MSFHSDFCNVGLCFYLFYVGDVACLEASNQHEGKLMQDAVVKTLVPDQWDWGWPEVAGQT